jgi:hypothetical protein
LIVFEELEENAFLKKNLVGFMLNIPSGFIKYELLQNFAPGFAISTEKHESDYNTIILDKVQIYE